MEEVEDCSFEEMGVSLILWEPFSEALVLVADHESVSARMVSFSDGVGDASKVRDIIVDGELPENGKVSVQRLRG